MAKVQDKVKEQVAEKASASEGAMSNVEEFFNKYKKQLLYVVGALVVAGGAYGFYKYTQNESNDQAQAEMYGAVAYWEMDSLDKAIKGDGKFVGLEAIADEYSGTDAGMMANYYLGFALLKKGKFEEAIERLKEFNAGDKLVQARAYCLIGDAYLELKDNDNAIEYYNKAVDHEPNEQFTPRYLLKLAVAYEENKDWANAVKAYSRIEEEYSKSAEAFEAKKFKARAEQMAAAK